MQIPIEVEKLRDQILANKWPLIVALLGLCLVSSIVVIGQKNNRIEDQAYEISQLGQTVSEQQGQIYDLEGTVSQLENEKEELEATIEELEGTIEELEAMVNHAQYRVQQAYNNW